MKDHVCMSLQDSTALRCWRLRHDDNEHFTVLPNHDTTINQHPVISTWVTP